MSQQSANNKMVIKLVAIVIGMFGFGFALVPLYDVFCDVTGINGKTEGTAAVYQSIEIDVFLIVLKVVELKTYYTLSLP